MQTGERLFPDETIYLTDETVQRLKTQAQSFERSLLVSNSMRLEKRRPITVERSNEMADRAWNAGMLPDM